jgi:hypothetical protein
MEPRAEVSISDSTTVAFGTLIVFPFETGYINEQVGKRAHGREARVEIQERAIR